MAEVVRSHDRPSPPRGTIPVMPRRRSTTHARRPVLHESTIIVDGLAVTVLRKRIANMYLRVRPQGAMVVVYAPADLGDERIAAYVRSKAGWITVQRSRILDAEANGDVLVWTPDAEAAARRVIEQRLPGLLARWRPIVGRSPSAVTIRKMTTRWGSCTPATGRIRLNLQLGLMEPKFLEYVVVHEMTHLWARGHGERFQRLMDGWLPGWRGVRREMNRQRVLPSPSRPC